MVIVCNVVIVVQGQTHAQVVDVVVAASGMVTVGAAVSPKLHLPVVAEGMVILLLSCCDGIG